MSKAIVVIDMPESCDMCDFVDDSVSTQLWCRLPGYGYEVTDYIACRPEECPLRELPRKMRVCGKYPQEDGIVPSYKIGWNACIDTILEGEEHE